MERLQATRRGFLAWAALCATAARATEGPRPSGPVVLSVTGRVTRRNAADGHDFDFAMLEALPQHRFSTSTPWYPKPRAFTGVLLRDLVAATGGSAETVRAFALNDYRVDIPFADALRHPLLVAHRVDERRLAVRDKGPLQLIYPFDADAQLRTAVYYGRAAWQLRRLELV